jgi:hypothetical protein
MSAQDTIHGLACPKCGGMVPIPEGQIIVKCPFCDQRSMVRGERGLQRYQVPTRISREQALAALSKFLSSHTAIAMDASKKSSLNEAFIAYLPFWTIWARILSWVFGQKRVSSGKTTTYIPKEVKITQDMSWNGAACEVGEFGVTTVPLTSQPLEPFDPVLLHDKGMVFEPVNSASDARSSADADFKHSLEQSAGLNRIGQVFARFLRLRMGLVYYPLWVLRYLYRGRSFQVVVDGYSGQVLYGKAPGNTLYRAAILVGGMAIGALLAIDAPALAWSLAAQTKGDSASFLFIAGLAVLVFGFGLMFTAYRTFRYGEQYEYRFGPKKSALSFGNSGDLVEKIKEITSWTDL